MVKLFKLECLKEQGYEPAVLHEADVRRFHPGAVHRHRRRGHPGQREQVQGVGLHAVHEARTPRKGSVQAVREAIERTKQLARTLAPFDERIHLRLARTFFLNG